jgi:predicted RNA-binding protein YlxR (DUF448 family)
MGRGGHIDERADGPERKCIATGESQPAAGLIRFVLGPDGTVVPDILGKLPGRGMWVSADRAALQKAADKNLFSRAAKAPAKVPERLVEDVEAQLVRRIQDLISLARKSGAAIAGYEKTKSWLETGRAKVLMQASDGSERGKGKLNTPRDGRYLGWMTAQELGVAFGRQTVIHGALAAGGLATKVVEEAAKLMGVREVTATGGRRKGKVAE